MTLMVRWLVAVAVAAFIVFVAVSAPATLVADRVAGTDPELTLSGVTGTAWRGRAQSVQYGPVALGTLDWRIAGARLFAGQGAARFALVGPESRLILRAHRALLTGHTRIADANGHLPLTLLAQLSGAHGPLDATVELDGVSFVQRGDDVESASGRIRLRDTVALAPRRYPLGDYVLDLDAVDGWLVGTIVDADGPLVLAGNVRIRGDGSWEVDARMRATQPDSELAMVLQLLGEPDDEGFRPLVLSGKL